MVIHIVKMRISWNADYDILHYSKIVGKIMNSHWDRPDNNWINISSIYISFSFCQNEKLCYIGQTSRNLKGRLTSHRSDCNLKKPRCALTQHAIETDHKINWNIDNVAILDKCNVEKSRAILEMIRIAQCPNTMNRKSDINHLSNIYSYLIKADWELLNLAFFNNTEITDS